MLTFEGFLFTALAIVSDHQKADTAVYRVLKYALPGVGIAVGLLALLAVLAAVMALSDLKVHWKPKAFPDYPPPFGESQLHAIGALYSLGLPIVMIVAWAFILVFLLREPNPAQQQTRPTTAASGHASVSSASRRSSSGMPLFASRYAWQVI
jgi:hypothetical protein